MVKLECSIAGCDKVEKKGTTMMEAIELMKFHRTNKHGQRGGEGSNRKKMGRPLISEEASEAKWKSFLSDWKRYKSSQNVKSAAEDIRNELLNCCHEDV